MYLNDELFHEINEYCRLNGISDVNKFIELLVRRAFTVEKYGTIPITAIKLPENKNNNQQDEIIRQTKLTTKNNKKDIYGE